jgi:hypothetical protein
MADSKSILTLAEIPHAQRLATETSTSSERSACRMVGARGSSGLDEGVEVRVDFAA